MPPTGYFGADIANVQPGYIYIYISTSYVVFIPLWSCFLHINKSLLVIDIMLNVVFTGYC
jgi:hypothetical protein